MRIAYSHVHCSFHSSLFPLPAFIYRLWFRKRKWVCGAIFQPSINPNKRNNSHTNRRRKQCISDMYCVGDLNSWYYCDYDLNYCSFGLGIQSKMLACAHSHMLKCFKRPSSTSFDYHLQIQVIVNSQLSIQSRVCVCVIFLWYWLLS